MPDRGSEVECTKALCIDSIASQSNDLAMKKMTVRNTPKDVAEALDAELAGMGTRMEQIAQHVDSPQVQLDRGRAFGGKAFCLLCAPTGALSTGPQRGQRAGALYERVGSCFATAGLRVRLRSPSG